MGCEITHLLPARRSCRKALTRISRIKLACLARPENSVAASILRFFAGAPAPEVLAMWRAATTGKPGGDRRSENAIKHDNVMIGRQGNSRAYTLDRLKRDALRLPHDTKPTPNARKGNPGPCRRKLTPGRSTPPSRARRARWNGRENKSPAGKIHQLIQLLIHIIGGWRIRRAAVVGRRNLGKRSFNPVSGGWSMLRWSFFKPQRARRIEAE